MASTQLLGGRYRLVQGLAQGGTAVVWRAYDEVLGRRVAIKVLSPAYAADAQFRARVLAEAQAAARLSHPHVTHVHDYGESEIDGALVPYVVMELLSGPTLAQRMQAGPLPVTVALRIAAQVAQALAAAHAHGLVHCDIKPANVMLTRSGAKVVDFGISAVAGQHDPHTPEGQVWGTPAYLAPERILGSDAVAATDVYALGVLLFQALSGTTPWPAKSTAQILLAHVCDEPAPLPPIADVPPEVATLCRRCLARNPANRPTAAEVARVLHEARAALKKAGRNSTVPVARPSSRRRRGAVLVAMAAAALVAGYWGLGGKEPDQADAVPAVPSITFSTGGEGDAAPPTSPAAPIGPAHAGAAPRGGAALPGGPPGVTGPAGGPVGPGGGSRSGRSPAPTTGSGSSGNGGHTQPADPRPVERTLSTVGGSVVARCVGSTASIVSASPLAGYTVGDLNRGPGTQASVAFNALVTTVRVVVHCSSGVPAASIQVG